MIVITRQKSGDVAQADGDSHAQPRQVYSACLTPSLPNCGSGRLPVRSRSDDPQWSQTTSDTFPARRASSAAARASSSGILRVAPTAVFHSMWSLMAFHTSLTKLIGASTGLVAGCGTCSLSVAGTFFPENIHQKGIPHENDRRNTNDCGPGRGEGKPHGLAMGAYPAAEIAGRVSALDGDSGRVQGGMGGLGITLSPCASSLARYTSPVAPHGRLGIGLPEEAAQPQPLRLFCACRAAFLNGGLGGAAERLAEASPVDQLRSVRLPMIGLVWRRVSTCFREKQS